MSRRETSTTLCCTVLCCAILHCAEQGCTVLHPTVLHCTILYSSVLHCANSAAPHPNILCCTILYCSVLYYRVLYYSVLYLICPSMSPAFLVKKSVISFSDSASNTVVGSKSAAHTSTPERSIASSPSSSPCEEWCAKDSGVIEVVMMLY